MTADPHGYAATVQGNDSEPEVGCAQQAPASVRAPDTMTARHSDLVIDGALMNWTPPEGELDAESASFRGSLGLSTDQPVVMTGHQAEFWHAGILTKYLAADAIARRSSGAGSPVSVAWCVPDHVAETPGAVAYPAHALDNGEGRWTRATIDLFDEQAGEDASPAVGSALDSVRAVLREAGGTKDADRQIEAQSRLLRDRLGLSPDAPPVLASTLHTTLLFRGLIERMRSEPDACVGAYNDAASALPDAGVRQLTTGVGRTELPLWRIDDAGRSHAVFLDDLDDTPFDRVRPRALLFTGLLRAHACDLFIHGTGGGVYDRVTERWLRDWLGWTLAPAGVATATLTLDLGVPDVSRTDLRRARWRAHHARHNPAALGESDALTALQRRKQGYLERIAETPRGERDPLYFEMHAMLEEARTAHARELGALDERVRTIESALADRAIARDRTWAWFLHSDEDLVGLREAIDRRLLGIDA